MVLKILQWNIRGYLNNYSNLQLLLANENPDIVCLQETKCKRNQIPHIPKKYNGHFYNTHDTSKQGTAILIKKGIPYKLINVSTPLCYLAIEINLSITLTVLSLYISPQDTVTTSHLDNLILNINSPLLILGDMNGWNPLWGSPNSNKRGKIIEDFLVNSNLSVLNNGSPTHLSTHNTLTHIDIGLASISLLPRCSWDTINDLYNSDHFPTKTCINIGANKSYNFQPKYITCKADWTLYKNNLTMYSNNIPTSQNVNKESAQIRKIIRLSANNSIPQTRNRKATKLVPWWSRELQILRSEKQCAWRLFCRNMSNHNLIDYKRKNAIFNRAKNKAKERSFLEFTQSLNPFASSSYLWKRIRLLTGNYTPHTIRTIEKNGNTISNLSDISASFGEYWSSNSKDSNFSDSFRQSKDKLLQTCQPPSTCSQRAKCLEDIFTLQELNSCLNSSKGKTPGRDKISYPMLKNSTITFKKRILDNFNNIFISGHIPQFF